MNRIITLAFLIFTTLYTSNTRCMLSKHIRPLEETKQTPQYKNNEPTKNSSKAIIQPSRYDDELLNQQLQLNIHRRLLEQAKIIIEEPKEEFNHIYPDTMRLPRHNFTDLVIEQLNINAEKKKEMTVKGRTSDEDPLTLRGVLKGHGNWVTDISSSNNKEEKNNELHKEVSDCTKTTGYCPVAFVRTGRSAIRMRPITNFDNK